MKASSRAIAATTLCFVACLLPTHLIHASSASGSSSSSKTAAAVQHTATPQQLPAATYEQGSDFEERFSREPQYLELRRGTKRLLAVRISTTYGEEPDESLAEIEGAVFGTGTNPDAIAADATVVAQYTAVSHNQVHFIPATQPEDEDAAVAAASRSSALLAVEDAINNTANNLTDGVMDVTVDTLFNGTDIHILTEFILNATRDALGGRALLEVADNYIFCLPNGSTFGSNAEWTAFTHLFEPVRFFCHVWLFDVLTMSLLLPLR
jgi:hypothetical protein